MPEGHDKPQPTVEQLLLDRIDEHVKVVGQGLDHLAPPGRPVASGAGPVVPECPDDGVGNGRRDPPAGPRPPARRGRQVSGDRRPGELDLRDAERRLTRVVVEVRNITGLLESVVGHGIEEAMWADGIEPFLTQALADLVGGLGGVQHALDHPPGDA
jgi:hypothetical protein